MDTQVCPLQWGPFPVGDFLETAPPKDDFEAAGRAALHIYGKQPNMGTVTVPWWDTYPLNPWEVWSPQPYISRQVPLNVCYIYLYTVHEWSILYGFLCKVNFSILWVCWLWVLRVTPLKKIKVKWVFPNVVSKTCLVGGTGPVFFFFWGGGGWEHLFQGELSR